MKQIVMYYLMVLFSMDVCGLQFNKAASSRSNKSLTLKGKQISRQQIRSESQSAKDLRIRDKLMKVAKLGTPITDAIMEVTRPTVNDQECGKRNQIGDNHEITWCQDAIDLVKDRHGNDAKGLSYGVYSWDNWSNEMNKRNNVATDLYDCYDTVDQIKTLQNDHLSTYTAPVKMHSTCVGSVEKVDEEGRKFEKLDSHLKDQGPLSTFVKMDIEGDEWHVLDDLQKNPEALDKVASLDFEMHFCPVNEHDDGPGATTRNNYETRHPEEERNKALDVLKGLLDKFEVVGRSESEGSTRSQNDKAINEESLKTCNGPNTMMSISYVNKDLMGMLRSSGQGPSAPMFLFIFLYPWLSLSF